MAEKVRLIALDMDGTVLNSQSKVSKGNLDQLLRAMQAGVEVMIATGRIYSTAQLFRIETGLELPMITANGADIYDADGTLIRQMVMTPASIHTLIRMAEDAGMYYHIFVDNTLYVRTKGKWVQSYLLRNETLKPEERLDIQALNFEQMLEVTKDGASKFIVMEDNAARLAEIRSRAEQVPDVNVVSSWSNNIEVVRAGVDKGHALQWYCEQRGIGIESVMAMGDNENDEGMLRVAGYSVAMGNATPQTRAAARYVTAHHDEDGVALAVRHFVFGEDVGDLKRYAEQGRGRASKAAPV